MIVTLTPNPAVDQTLWVPRLRLGDVNRVPLAHLDPAGKGINVARMAQRLGGATVAFGFLAGEAGLLVEKALNEEGIPHSFARVPGQTRINLTLVEEARATSFFGPGPEVTSADCDVLERAISPWLQPGSILVLAGSLPPGAPRDMYARFIHLARGRGARVILDSGGEAFRLGVAQKPDVIKPNQSEAEQLLGRVLPDDAAILEGARELAAKGIGCVIVSLGDRGAYFVEGVRAWRVRSPHVPRRSSIGSGDSMVAGIAVALDRNEPAMAGVRLGTAAGAATAASSGTSLGSAVVVAELLPMVEVEELGDALISSPQPPLS